MVDSTYPAVTGTEQGTFAERWNAERRLRTAVRNALTVRLDMRCLDAVMQQFDGDAPPHADAHRLAALHIACQAALTLGWVWDGKRSMWPTEASIFRMLGGLAARAGLSGHEATAALTSGIDRAIATARTNMENDSVPFRTWLGVLDHLKSEADAFATEANKELRHGMESPPSGGGDKVTVLRQLVDGRMPHEAIGAAASSAGLDASREHGVALLIHPGGFAAPLEDAARDIEAAIPGAVDLGLGEGLSNFRRVVFPVLTHGCWLEARANLHNIAIRHGILAIAPIQAPTLGRLAETCQATQMDLARVVRGCGYRRGVIDPARVGPACPAEGASPAPVEEWSIEAPVTAVA